MGTQKCESYLPEIKIYTLLVGKVILFSARNLFALKHCYTQNTCFLNIPFGLSFDDATFRNPTTRLKLGVSTLGNVS